MTKRVSLLFDPGFGYCRAVVRGVQSYVEEHANWALFDALPIEASLTPLQDWKPHGVIAHLFDPEVAAKLQQMPFPVVNFTTAVKGCELPLVEVDHEKIGQLAADFFLQRNYTSFGFFGSRRLDFSRAREKAFKVALHDHGHSCSSCYEDLLPRALADESWTSVERHIADWIKKLRKPVAIFVSNDFTAKYLVNVCANLQINIPREASLLSVDDVEFDCNMTNPRLSSIAIPGFRIGYESAKLLDSMMHGNEASASPLFLPPIGIVLRQSTDETAVDDEDIKAFLDWIRVNYSSQKGIDEVCAQIGIGRRSLERKMRQLTGRSILDVIMRARIDAAMRLLAESNSSIDTIARKCGFSGSRRMATVFRQALGSTPLEFRKRCQGKIR